MKSYLSDIILPRPNHRWASFEKYIEGVSLPDGRVPSVSRDMWYGEKVFVVRLRLEDEDDVLAQLQDACDFLMSLAEKLSAQEVREMKPLIHLQVYFTTVNCSLSLPSDLLHDLAGSAASIEISCYPVPGEEGGLRTPEDRGE